ncbi:MAG: extracellular solute-binding protein [Verrucomicrobiaceae bacterium]|nr:MAG: extracellular solute-binding protein [Verrucomicrobiaceae bacterium]
MKTRVLIIFGLLALIVALPLVLRRETATTSSRRAEDHLVVLTPHNESIRNEFGEAFAAWWKKETGRSIHVDWRTPGGTSEIRMVLDAGYKAAAETGREGIGVDVFFGGGEPDFSGQAKKGRLVPLRVFETRPEMFAAGGPVPETFTGERYYPPDHVWVGTCMSQFGICYNPDVIARLKLTEPKAWRDLGDPGYAGTLALADPTKSGSVARAFELLVQGEMLRALEENPGDREAALGAGWAAGLQLIQKMAANSRYFTDSASKIPHDVGQGNAAAGMCIDFYGRSYAHELKSATGKPRVVWIAPLGGTTLSADPIGVLKGAQNMEVAQRFVEFCLSPDAQVLWFAKPGTPHGPQERALHRTPIRRDVYTPENLANSTMPDADPYQDPGNFTYERELTGAAFNTLRQLVKVMCIDSHEEIKSAWRAMKDAGMPADALAVFCDVSIMPYAVAGKGDPRFDGSDPLETAANAARIGEWFRANYRKAEAMAKKTIP